MAEGCFHENWKKLAAAVVLQAAVDYVNPHPVETRSQKIMCRLSAKEFFERAARKKQERFWFDILGINPAALLNALEEGPPEPLLRPRLLQKQACGERTSHQRPRPPFNGGKAVLAGVAFKKERCNK